MHIVIRVDKESLKKSHQHANEANVCSKYQPCSQAAFSLFYEAWTLSNISDDVAFMAQSIPSVNIAPPPPTTPGHVRHLYFVLEKLQMPHSGA